jgi:hypothetical protein
MRPRARITPSAQPPRWAAVLVLATAATASLGVAGGRAAVSGPSASSGLAGVWRRLPPAPSPAAAALTVSAWTGRQMVIFGRAYPKPPLGIDVAAAYTPATNTWRRLVPLKGPVGNFQGDYHAVWTGKEMLVLGPFDFQAYDLTSNRWRHPATPPTGVDGAGLLVWTGKEMIDWGGGCCGDAFATGWAFNPVTNRWRKLPSSPLAPSQSPTGVWTGHELIVLVSGLDPDGKPYPSSLARIAAYDPVSNAWRRLVPLPAPRFNAEAAGMATRCSSSAVSARLRAAGLDRRPRSVSRTTQRPAIGDRLRRCPPDVQTSPRCGPVNGC